MPVPISITLACASKHQRKTALSSNTSSNLALNLAPFSRWTLRDRAAQRRLALR